MSIALLSIFATALVALYFDASVTAKGVAAGIAEEANFIVRKFFGSRPSLKQILIAEVPQRLFVLGVGFIPGPDAYPATFQVLAATTLVAFALHNVKGAREWKWLFAHPSQKLPELNTVWQKLVGFWG